MSAVGRVARSESRYLRRKKLGGTQAADLPFVQPIKLEFAVNLTRLRRRSASKFIDAARASRRGDRMSAPGKAGAIQPVEVRLK